MPNKFYVREAAHERRIKKKKESLGYDALRSAHSEGKIDVIAWNNERIELIASQFDQMFHPAKMRSILTRTKKPPNSTILFYVGNLEITERQAWNMVKHYQKTEPRELYEAALASGHALPDELIEARLKSLR